MATLESKQDDATPSATDTAAMRSLMKEVSEMDRVDAINKILQSIKVNPIDILQLPVEYTDDDVKKQYRHLSRLVHPDRIKNEQHKEFAIKAFAKLANAKKLITIEAKEKDNKDNESVKFVKNFKRQIIEAKRRVIARKHNENSENNEKNTDENKNTNMEKHISDEPPAKRQKLMINGTNSNNGNNKNDSEKEKEKCKDDLGLSNEILITEEEWKAELREVITSDEWDKHLANKANDRREFQERRRREEVKAQREAEIARVKQWEAGTNARVNSWRNFRSKGKKSKKKGKKRSLNDI